MTKKVLTIVITVLGLLAIALSVTAYFRPEYEVLRILSLIVFAPNLILIWVLLGLSQKSA